jgi:hypothetical protein
MTISLLNRFKPSTYFLEILDEWLVFSYDSEELKLLEKIVVEEDGKIGINLLKRHGIHPSEDEAIKDAHQAFTNASKAYFNLIEDISNKTGLSRTEIQLRIPQDISDIEEEIKATNEKAKEDSWNYLEIRKEIQKIKQTTKEETAKIAEILSPFSEQFQNASIEYNKSFDEYYIQLIALFLSGKRLEGTSKATFTPQNIRNLHVEFRGALAGFVTNEIRGWAKDAGKN